MRYFKITYNNNNIKYIRFEDVCFNIDSDIIKFNFYDLEEFKNFSINDEINFLRFLKICDVKQKKYEINTKFKIRIIKIIKNNYDKIIDNIKDFLLINDSSIKKIERF